MVGIFVCLLLLGEGKPENAGAPKQELPKSKVVLRLEGARLTWVRLDLPDPRATAFLNKSNPEGEISLLELGTRLAVAHAFFERIAQLKRFKGKKLPGLFVELSIDTKAPWQAVSWIAVIAEENRIRRLRLIVKEPEREADAPTVLDWVIPSPFDPPKKPSDKKATDMRILKRGDRREWRVGNKRFLTQEAAFSAIEASDALRCDLSADAGVPFGEVLGARSALKKIFCEPELFPDGLPYIPSFKARKQKPLKFGMW